MTNDFRLDSYRPLKTLSKGPYGEVVLAEHRKLHCRRIIKTVFRIHPFYDRLTNEARILQKLRNEAIPIVYDVFEDQNGFTFIEEAIEGESLALFLKRKKHLGKSEILDLSIKLSQILIYIHKPGRRILHLDVKPENIIISENKPRLIDFGSAVCSAEEKDEGCVFGTYSFCAPEQITGEGDLCEATDIYGLGRTMEYMLTYAKEIPGGYKAVVDNCLRRGKALYTDAGMLMADLEKLRGKAGKKLSECWIAVCGIPTGFHGSCFSYGLAKTIKRRMGQGVLLVDCNEAGNLEHLGKKEQDTLVSQGFTYETDGITVAARVLPDEARRYRGRGFRYILCDFGDQSNWDPELSFDCIVLVGSMTPWTRSLWERSLFTESEDIDVFAVVTESMGAGPRAVSEACTVLDATSPRRAEHAAGCILKKLTKKRKRLVTDRS